jgi:hypothetical protein
MAFMKTHHLKTVRIAIFRPTTRQLSARQFRAIANKIQLELLLECDGVEGTEEQLGLDHGLVAVL